MALGSNANSDSVGAHEYGGKWQDRYNDKPPPASESWAAMRARRRRKKINKVEAPGPTSPVVSAIGVGEDVQTCGKCGHAPHAGRCEWRRQVVGFSGEGEHDLECECHG